MIRIPYGISSYAKLIYDGAYYVDRTTFLPKIEALGSSYLFFLRPRRFGKSLFVTMLHHYYGVEFKDQFESLFGAYFVGQHPTPLANQYLIFRLDFSGIHTHTPEATLQGFLKNVQYAVKSFVYAYKNWFGEEDISTIESMQFPGEVLQHLFALLKEKTPDRKLYVLIDEYDHFANELLSFNFKYFTQIVGKNGFVRKFYEVLKQGTVDYIVDRIFITGISPVTLDSLTSGFNIGTNITTDLRFHNMMGFTEAEVRDILKGIDIEKNEISSMLIHLRQWYNGYMFHPETEERVYNSDMIWYFADRYNEQRKYPAKLLDTNIASDYGKISKLTRIQGKDEQNLEVLREVIERQSVTATLTEKYSFDEDKEWTRDDFISLLFYQGILTIAEENISRLVFAIPNFVIRQLYFQFFYHLTLRDARLSHNRIPIEDFVDILAQQNDIRPLIEHTENVLAQLAVEDRAHYNELQIKIIFTSLFYQVGHFNIFSELEVRKGDTEKGRVDLLVTRRPPFHVNNQFVFELKYLSNKQKGQLEAVKQEAVQQLQAYIQHDEKLRNLEDLQAYVIVFVVNKAVVERV